MRPCVATWAWSVLLPDLEMRKKRVFPWMDLSAFSLGGRGYEVPEVCYP